MPKTFSAAACPPMCCGSRPVGRMISDPCDWLAPRIAPGAGEIARVLQ
jgi:hypothetical protein